MAEKTKRDEFDAGMAKISQWLARLPKDAQSVGAEKLIARLIEEMRISDDDSHFIRDASDR